MIFLFHYTFFLPEFKLYSCICPPHEQVISWFGLYTRTRVFLLRFWEQISQPLFNDSLSYATFFQNSLQWSLYTSLTILFFFHCNSHHNKKIKKNMRFPKVILERASFQNVVKRKTTWGRGVKPLINFFKVFY